MARPLALTLGRTLRGKLDLLTVVCVLGKAAVMHYLLPTTGWPQGFALRAHQAQQQAVPAGHTLRGSDLANGR